MKSSLSHLQFLIDYKNVDFYKSLMEFLGWKEVFSDEGVCGFSNGEEGSASMWFLAQLHEGVQDHDQAGMNHVGIGVKEQSDVDKAVAYLKENNIEPLFGTPTHRPEFSFGEGQTYYQVMFESPDKVLFEIVYTGPKV